MRRLDYHGFVPTFNLRFKDVDDRPLQGKFRIFFVVGVDFA